MAMLVAAGLLATALAGGPAPWFTDITESAGIPSLRHGEGVNAVDINCDQRPDLYLPSVRDRARLLINLGDGRFRDVTDSAGLLEKGGVGAAVGDLNGDRLPDIYVARGADPYVAPNLVYLQRPDGTFADASRAAGVAGHSSGLTVTLADFTGDGYRDAFLPGWGGDVLFVGSRRGSFNEAGRAAGFTDPGRGWSALPSDLDGDGDLDLFVTRGSHTVPHDNRLYLNRGDGRFSDATATSGLERSPWSLGAVSADFDGDGDFDLYVAGYGGPGRLYRNDGGARFTDVTVASGITAAKCVGVAAGPIDGDLLPDLAVAGFAGPVQIYRNLGQMRFAPVGEPAGVKPVSRNEGLALADIDNDGDLDLYVTNVDGKNRLYLNSLNNARFLKVRFPCGGPPAEGSVARLSRGGIQLALQELAGAVGMGQGPAELIFRLPDNGPFELAVTLPDGRTIERPGLGPGILQIP